MGVCLRDLLLLDTPEPRVHILFGIRARLTPFRVSLQGGGTGPFWAAAGERIGEELTVSTNPAVDPLRQSLAKCHCTGHPHHQRIGEKRALGGNHCSASP